MKPIFVHEWMRTDVITINPELRVERVWELMEHQRIRHLPVVKNGTLVGIITERDLKRAIFPSLSTRIKSSSVRCAHDSFVHEPRREESHRETLRFTQGDRSDVPIFCGLM